MAANRLRVDNLISFFMFADLPDLALLVSERVEIGTADNDYHGEASTLLWPLGTGVVRPL